MRRPGQASVLSVALIIAVSILVLAALTSLSGFSSFGIQPVEEQQQVQEFQTAMNIGACTGITSPGVYVLTANISNSNAAMCINVFSDNVIIDCQGNIIDGQDGPGTIGVQIRDGLPPVSVKAFNPSASIRQNVTIRNCVLTDWEKGISFTNTWYGLIKGNTLSSNTMHGIYLTSSSNNYLTDNTVSNNQQGIYLVANSQSNNLTNNTVSGSAPSNGITIDSSNRSTLTSNTANYGPTSNGVYIVYSSNSTLTSNTFNNNGNGVWLYASPNNTLASNTATNNNNGIALTNSPNNILTSNTAARNNNGIRITDTTNSSMPNNIACNNAVYDIYFSGVGSTGNSGSNIYNILQDDDTNTGITRSSACPTEICNDGIDNDYDTLVTAQTLTVLVILGAPLKIIVATVLMKTTMAIQTAQTLIAQMMFYAEPLV